MAWVFANNHDSAVTTDYFALIANFLNAWLYLHDVSFVAVLVLTVICEPLLAASVLFVAVDDSAAAQVVRGQLYDYAILRENSNVMLTHLSRDVSEHYVPVCQLNTKHRVGQGFNNLALDLDDAVFLGHSLTIAINSNTGRAK